MSEMYIRRVKNGWIVVPHNSRAGVVNEEYVFSSPDGLAIFIKSIAKEQEDVSKGVTEA